MFDLANAGGFAPPAFCFSPMTPEQLAPLLEQLGCPPEKACVMAGQLDKRARQLAVEKGRSYDESLAHLLNLMKQGWAAQEKEL